MKKISQDTKTTTEETLKLPDIQVEFPKTEPFLGYESYYEIILRDIYEGLGIPLGIIKNENNQKSD